MELRPYQQEAKDAVWKEWESGHTKTLLVMPTGCGKTIVFAKITEDAVRKGGRVLILAHRGELLEQAADKLQKSCGLQCAVEKAEQKKSLERRGIDASKVENAGKAEQLLRTVTQRQMEGLTTPKQIRCLERYGFSHVGNWQFQDAKNLIDRIAANGWRLPHGIRPNEFVPEEKQKADRLHSLL